MYKSPIELLVADIEHQIVKQQDEEIYKAVLHYIPNIDREELLLALKYDRDQYEKGYADGKADTMADLVRCKDCKHFWESFSGSHSCKLHKGLVGTKYDTFCSYGERKDND